tara:strand:- start:25 stop:147 length:123 start_codon:yes stop_codon:yes gene_type:complete
MHLNIKKDQRYKRVEQALRKNLKKRKNFQTKTKKKSKSNK